MFLGCIYCNKWQEAQLFEFVPNQKSKTIELKEKTENTNLELASNVDRSSQGTIPSTSENTNDKNTIVELSDFCSDMSQNVADKLNSLKQEDISMDADSSVLENDKAEISYVAESSREHKKKIKRRLGFLQMRIDSTIYYDNMGYSYQIQNEKNDKK